MRHLRTLIRASRALCGMLLCALSLCAMATDRPMKSVGTVTFLVGRVQATDLAGVSRELSNSSDIRVGDSLETGVGAHVHVRFIDGGRVSLRPGSRMAVLSYAPKEDAGTEGGIRLRLEEGLLRSVTGQWGEQRKETFRLETPMAAIGIRGTDFAVRTDPESTAASVYSGSIVISGRRPEGGACSAAAACSATGQRELVLEASMKGQMVEVRSGQYVPQLVPASDLLSQASRRMLPEGWASRIDPDRRLSGSGGTAENSVATSSSDRQLTLEVRGIQAAQQAEKLPAPKVSSLFWATSHVISPDDNLSIPMGQALASGLRSTVGTFSYTLMTSAPPLPPSAVVGSGESTVSFRLSSAYASLVDQWGQKIENLSVLGAALTLDFSRSQFSTKVNLSGKTLGPEAVSVSGNISPLGYLLGNQNNQIVAGALSPDGKEAGYAFEKRITPGVSTMVINGITLWGR